MKQTEIGMIPDDWEVKELGKITTHVDYRGKTPHKTNQGIQLITAKNIRMGYIDYKNNQEFVSENDYLEVMKRGLPHKGDVLITTEAPAGNVAQIDNENIALAQRVIKYTGKECISNDYLCKYFLSSYFQNLLKSMNTGGTVQGIKGSLLHTLPVILPPTLSEQQKIAKALNDVDNVITTLEKLITKKKNLKQGTMQQLLTGKKRLPGFAQTTASKQTELGEIPADWEIVNINKTCTIKARIGWQGLKSDEYLDTGDYLLITGTDFDNGFINWKNCNYVTEWRFKQDKNIQIKKGDVLITKDGTIGKVAFLNEVPMDGTLNSGIFVVRPKDSNIIDSVFLSLIFKSFWFDNFLEQITSGSTIVHLYQKDFVKFNYILPSKPEQTAIANVLSSMDKEIEALNTKLEKYRNLKTGMMQQLLTGKIRLI